MTLVEIQNIIDRVRQLGTTYLTPSRSAHLITNIKHSAERVIKPVIDAYDTDSQTDLGLTLLKADFSNLIKVFCDKTQYYSYHLVQMYQWLRNNKTNLDGLTRCQYGKTLPEIENYIGRDQLSGLLQNFEKYLNDNQADTVFILYLEKLLKTSDGNILCDQVKKLDTIVSRRIDYLYQADIIVKQLHEKEATLHRRLCQKFSTIDPKLSEQAYALAGKLCEDIAKSIEAICPTPSKENIESLSNQLILISSLIDSINNNNNVYSERFKPLQLIIENALLWVNSQQHNISYENLFVSLATFNDQLKTLPDCYKSLCIKSISPLWIFTSSALSNHYMSANRKEKISEGSKIVKLLSRIGELFKGNAEEKYLSVYNNYCGFIQSSWPSFSNEEKENLRAQDAEVLIYHQNRFFDPNQINRAPILPNTNEPSDVSSSEDPGNSFILSMNTLQN